MKKLRLDLEDIRVDSFHMQDAAREPGTIHGNQDGFDALAITGWSWLCGSCDPTCAGAYTCVISCGGAGHSACASPFCRDSELYGNCPAVPALPGPGGPIAV